MYSMKNKKNKKKKINKKKKSKVYKVVVPEIMKEGKYYCIECDNNYDSISSHKKLRYHIEMVKKYRINYLKNIDNNNEITNKLII
jgi:hypothetical protein